MNDSGFGICGHKNTYSTGVKVGNYVEDQIGKQLASHVKIHPTEGTTENRVHYTDPATMPDKCKNAPVTNEIENQIAREGLSYQMIFAHGPGIVVDASADTTRWTTTNTLLHGKNPVKSNALLDDRMIQGKVIDERSKARELLKQQAREKRMMTSYMTTKQADSSLIRP